MLRRLLYRAVTLLLRSLRTGCILRAGVAVAIGCVPAIVKRLRSPVHRVATGIYSVPAMVVGTGSIVEGLRSTVHRVPTIVKGIAAVDCVAAVVESISAPVHRHIVDRGAIADVAITSRLLLVECTRFRCPVIVAIVTVVDHGYAI